MNTSSKPIHPPSFIEKKRASLVNIGEKLTGLDLDGDGDVNDGHGGLIKPAGAPAAASRDSSPSTPLKSKLLTFDKLFDNNDKRQVQAADTIAAARKGQLTRRSLAAAAAGEQH